MCWRRVRKSGRGEGEHSFFFFFYSQPTPRQICSLSAELPLLCVWICFPQEGKLSESSQSPAVGSLDRSRSSVPPTRCALQGAQGWLCS